MNTAMAGARQHVLITVIGQRRAPYRLLEVNGFAGMEEPFQAFFASIPYGVIHQQRH